MTISQTISGAYRITARVNGYYVTRRYDGYTEQQAIKLFRAEMAERAN